MNDFQWKNFSSFRVEFKNQVSAWKELLEKNNLSQTLIDLQQKAAVANKTPLYAVENPFVYNTALDSITPQSNIKLIVIGDNPGKNEQLECNKSYLVGQAGKIADGFFKKNAELAIDFRKNVIILNKTPIHSAKTKELSFILRHAPPMIVDLFYESQLWMAEKTAALHKALNHGGECSLWIVGYGELRQKALFSLYQETLSKIYLNDLSCEYANRFLVFQHFSMNRFAIDLNDFFKGKYGKCDNFPIKEAIQKLGLYHRKEIFFF
ncbi:MAG: hypothetical protein ACRC4W_03995 [Treponemataceae bacterium]